MAAAEADVAAAAEGEEASASPAPAPRCENAATTAASSEAAGGAEQSTAAASESTEPPEPAASAPAESSPAPRSLHQLFVTANPILRLSVARSFKSLQTGFVATWRATAVPPPHATTAEEPQSGDPKAAAAAAAGGAGAAAAEAEAEAEEESTGMEVSGSLAEVSEAHWPLFLRAHHWLRLIDGAALPTLVPRCSPALALEYRLLHPWCKPLDLYHWPRSPPPT